MLSNNIVYEFLIHTTHHTHNLKFEYFKNSMNVLNVIILWYKGLHNLQGPYEV
jgi:hypothetical protein